MLQELPVKLVQLVQPARQELPARQVLRARQLTLDPQVALVGPVQVRPERLEKPDPPDLRVKMEF